MKRPRAAGFAGSGLLLLTVAISGALGASAAPGGFSGGDRPNVGQALSAYQQQGSESSPRGECVSAVADSAAVGGTNNNHGGAVSESARTTCWDSVGGKPGNGPKPNDAGSRPGRQGHGHAYGHSKQPTN